VADAMVERFAPMWETREKFSADPKQTQEVVEEGRKRASVVAKETMGEVKEAMKV
jgi:hypothetical protein